MGTSYPAPGWGRGRRPFPPFARAFGGFSGEFDRPATAHPGHEHHHRHHEMTNESGEEFEPGFPPTPPPPPGPPGFRPRGGRRGVGGPGFGPFAAAGFGPGFGPPFGPGGHGHRGGRGRRGGRRGRGNVRAAVLALLAEQPRHGYAIMNELGERSGGLWRPSPGSVYPVLQQLQDEGLVAVEEADGRRVFTLTDTGRQYVTEHPDELHEPWNVAEDGPRERVQSIMFAVQALEAAAGQVARLADDAQAEQAVAAIDEARKALYRILAGEPE
jgi:DNA-binding PadR family transcriptional regulator